MLEIPGFEGYYATRDGKIYSAWRQESRGGHANGFYTYLSDDKIEMFPTMDQGYWIIVLKQDGMAIKRPIHYFILLTFVGDRPFPEAVCRHLDGNPLNNYIDNLCWGTVQENAQDRIQHGTHFQGETHPRSILTEAIVKEIFALPTTQGGRLRRGVRHKLAEKYGIRPELVSEIRAGSSWNWLR